MSRLDLEHSGRTFRSANAPVRLKELTELHFNVSDKLVRRQWFCAIVVSLFHALYSVCKLFA